jgi:tRNA (guanine37-N1)-methyltransferase
MKISILTLFPEMFTGPFDNSIIKHAQEKGLVEIEYINIRNFGIGKHKLVDDTPYGGGIGMVMRVDVIHNALFATKCAPEKSCEERTILLTASGEQFKQLKAKRLAEYAHIILICGHYEGIDERIKYFIDEELSVGDFVVTGGEIPAMMITDAIVRLIPGVLTEGATQQESFSYASDDKILLEYPQYTRPSDYDKFQVPEILLSGNHAEIEKWRQKEAINKTSKVRPEMLDEGIIKNR